jgi:type IV pilus assembly protein PilB
MVTFNDKEQAKKIAEIRNKEEEAFVERISKKFNLPYIDLSGVTIETDALSFVDESLARKSRLAPFKVVGKKLYVGVKSPNLPETKKLLSQLDKEFTLGIYMVSDKSLRKAWDRYQDLSHAHQTQGGMLDISADDLLRIADQINTNDDIAELITTLLAGTQQKKTSELMEVIFGGAIATKASDVHIESQDEQVRLRFRQDGVLQDICSFSHEAYTKLLSRIKLLSKMKLTQHQNAQDGRFTIDFDDKEIEVRVSVIPSAYGESFVMRILNPDGIRVGIENLGIEPRLYEILLKEIKKPNGMILTTGPTGSGKTTTLYSFLRKVYQPEVKILTIEDPIEYHLDGISQTQVEREKGYDFLSGLRAALRQDPDIVMVGEIRDSETATIAVNASLTGHLVLSTLHTNGAAGVIPRLIDLGVSPQILAAALSVSLAQRLVRKLCTHCSYQEEPTEEERNLIQGVITEARKNNKPLEDYGISLDQTITVTKSKGCEHCNNTGYKGRIGIFEAIITDEKIEELLNKKPSEQEVRRVAEQQGLLNMREDGVIKVLNGVTSLEEVQSVVDLETESYTQYKKEEHTKHQEIIPLDTNISPKSLLGDNHQHHIAITLLLDYLEKLEDEQRLNPDIDASKDIQKIYNTIHNLMSEKEVEEVFSSVNKKTPYVDIHRRLEAIKQRLAELNDHQQKNPTFQTADHLKNIRHDLQETFSQ